MRFNKVVQTRHGQMIVNRNDRYIGRCLDEYGEFSEAEVRLLSALIGPSSLVIDIGANIGALTVPLAKVAAAVMAFEPQPAVFQVLCANVAINSLINVHTFQAAITTQAGQIEVPLLDPRLPNNFGALNLFLDAPQKTLAASMKLDGLAIPSCALIKCDVEGMEEIVLRSGLKMIAAFRPAIYVENDREENAESLIALLRSLNCRLFSHLPPLFEQENFNGSTVNVFGEPLVSLNVLAWPSERPLPVKPEEFGLSEIISEESTSPLRVNECESVP